MTINNPGESQTLSEIDVAGCPVVDRVQDSELLSRGASLFLDHGFLIIRNAFDAGYIQMLHDEFIGKYKDYFMDRQYSDALGVGNKRTMVTIAFDGLFSAPDFYANPVVYPLLKYLLGYNLILNGMGSVVSLPGSIDQHIHIDAPNIYATETNRSADFSWMRHAPPYAVTLGVPLVPVTRLTGHTRFWPGTHLRPISKNDLRPAGDAGHSLGPGVDYTAEPGTCFLFDYRIMHQGIANNSDQIRPLIYNIYSRIWWRDTANYYKQPPLIMSEEQFGNVPENYRHLFTWALR